VIFITKCVCVVGYVMIELRKCVKMGLNGFVMVKFRSKHLSFASLECQFELGPDVTTGVFHLSSMYLSSIYFFTQSTWNK